MVGVLGGMGPLATADFITKLIAMTPAEWDDDHIPLIVNSCPQIPSRVDSISDPHAPSPLPDLKDRLEFLLSAGVRFVVMPCNTAHHWHKELAQAAAPVPFVHIVDAVAEELVRRNHWGRVGLIATEGTLKAGIYQDRLAARGWHCVLPAEDVIHTLVLPGIDGVKANRVAEAESLLREAVRRTVAEGGVETVILACTEIPAALPTADPWLRGHCVDATEALAKATLSRVLAARKSAPS
ncbi:MAG: aspartate/glutamate racemase family protein [Alphaproteobacteria bacterium]|nr:aspartate/glutamate racemase family protein [Alphaproteobacteria bacterium]